MSVLIFPCSGNTEGKKLTEKNLSKYLSSWIGTESFMISKQILENELKTVECVVGGRYVNITELSGVNVTDKLYLHLYYYTDSGNIYTTSEERDSFVIDSNNTAPTKTVTINGESKTLSSYTLDLNSTPKLFSQFTIDGGKWDGSNFI